jgi:adenosine deaminase
MMWRRLCIGFFCCLKVMAQQPIDVRQYESQIKQIADNPEALYALMKQIPKGADLHLHVSGAVKTEDLIQIANQNDYCIGTHLDIMARGCEPQHTIKAYLAKNHGFQKLLKAWSMQDFQPNAHEDGKSHFFNTFPKFRMLTKNHRSEIVAKILNEAAAQNIQYLELMVSMSGERPAIDVNDIFHNASAQYFIQHNVQYFENLYLAAYRQADRKGQGILFNWMIEISREQPIEQFKRDALYAFAITSQSSHVAAVNMVMPEYGEYSHQDYIAQMEWMHYLQSLYPNVPVVLHAGEIPEDFAKKDAFGHVSTAINIAQPLRIGHGVSIVHEKNYENLMEKMKNQGTAVEINLTSNADILGIVGKKHPLNTYLAHQVPVVLSSDDPGVSRNNLSHEYTRAFYEQNLSLQNLIDINRNGLTYSLLSGPSIWEDAQSLKTVAACRDLNSPQCDNFVKYSVKAMQQRELELRLHTFFDMYFRDKQHAIYASTHR